MGFAKRYAGPERRFSKPSPVFIALAVLGVAGIAYATLCPIGMRPHLASADQERFGAYFVLGGAVALAAPRRWLSSTLFVVALAIGLEASQLLVPGRDARVGDALIKACGGVLGSAVGHAVFPAKRLAMRLLGWDAKPALAPVEPPSV
jgi:hypothetical protein